jgi:hypothetical protein
MSWIFGPAQNGNWIFGSDGVAESRLGGFEMSSSAKNAYRKPHLQKMLERRAGSLPDVAPEPKRDVSKDIEMKAAQMLLDKKGEQSLDALYQKWSKSHPGKSKAVFVARVKSRIAGMMDAEDSLIGLMK